MELTRTFISIELPKEIIKEIARIQSLLPEFKGKLIEKQNLHLTLKFLGEISQETLTKTKSLLYDIKFQPLELQLSNIGTFSHHGKPRIAWIHIKGAEKLQQDIDNTLSPIFPKEERFMSHLTIARIKHAKNPKELINKIQNLKSKPLSFNVNNFKLKSSELTPKSPIYITLETYNSKT